jgi:hypothetical protein
MFVSPSNIPPSCTNLYTQLYPIPDGCRGDSPLPGPALPTHYRLPRIDEAQSPTFLALGLSMFSDDDGDVPRPVSQEGYTPAPIHKMVCLGFYESRYLSLTHLLESTTGRHQHSKSLSHISILTKLTLVRYQMRNFWTR